jgi:hypothetical protein
MAKKAFEIQSSDLKLGGVNLQAGTTGVVIPGVTQAVNYFVEEVDEQDSANPDTFGSDTEAVQLLDNAAYLFRSGTETPSGSYSEAGYSVQELDDGEIEEIYVEVEGTFSSADKAFAEAGNMWATTVPNAKTNFSAGDWTQIAFRPKMRAGEVVNVGGGGGIGNLSIGDNDESILSDDGNKFVNFNGINNGLILGTINNKNVIVSLDDGGSNWEFSTDGSLTFPDGTVQTTAYTGQTGGSTSSTLYVAVNNDGRVFTSTNGLSWTEYTTTMDSVGRVAVGPDIIVFTASAVDASNGNDDALWYASTSAPGTVTEVTGFDDFTLNQVKYFANIEKFVAVGNNTNNLPVILYSSNGTSWTQVDLDSGFLAAFNSGAGYTNNAEFSDIETNGTGFLLTTSDINLGAFYTTNITTSMGSSNWIDLSGPGLDDNFGKIAYATSGAFTGWHILQDDDPADDAWYYNSSTDPRNGSFTEFFEDIGSIFAESVNYQPDISEVVFGSYQDATTIMVATDDGQILYWPAIPAGPFVSIPKPYTATDFSINQSTTAAITFGDKSANTNEKIVLSNCTPSDYNGTYYVGSGNMLYTNTSVSVAFDSSALDPFVSGTLTFSHGQYIDALHYSNGVFYAGNDDEEMFVSTNGGATWTLSDTFTGSPGEPEYMNDIDSCIISVVDTGVSFVQLPDGSLQAQASTVEVAALNDALTDGKPDWLSITPRSPDRETLDTHYGFDGSGMWFTGNNEETADDQPAYPIHTTASFPADAKAVVEFDISLVSGNEDWGVCVYPADGIPVWSWQPHPSRIAATVDTDSDGDIVAQAELNGLTNNAEGANVLTADVAQARFTYDPLAELTTFELLNSDGAVTSRCQVPGRLAPGKEYKIGFDADWDDAGPTDKSYFTNLNITVGSTNVTKTTEFTTSGEVKLPNTIKGFVNMQGPWRNNESHIEFQSVTTHNGFAYIGGECDWSDDNNGRIEKYSLTTGELVWSKIIGAGRNAQFNISWTGGAYTLDSISTPGIGYRAGELLYIAGNSFTGGNDVVNRATITVTAVFDTGGIYTATIAGTAPSGTDLATNVTESYPDAMGFPISLDYDTVNDNLVVLSYQTSMSGDATDTYLEQATVLRLDPASGDVVDNVTLTDQGDMYSYDVATHPTTGAAAVVGEKFNEYIPFGTLTMLATGNGYFDILKSNLDEEHWPGNLIPSEPVGNFLITGTGITGTASISTVNYYPGIACTPRQGSGATFDVIANDGDPGIYSVTVTSGGSYYVPGHKIKIFGGQLGGTDGVNDLILTIATVTPSVTVTLEGTADGGAQTTYTGVSGSNYQVGSGLSLNVTVDPITGSITTSIAAAGSNYVSGDVAIIEGNTYANGVSTADDTEVTVVGVGGSGAVTSVATSNTPPTDAVRIRVDGIDFTAVGGSWSMKLNLQGEAFVWTPVWNKAIGGGSNDRFQSVVYSKDGSSIYAVGNGYYETSYSQSLVVKFATSDGTIDFSKYLNSDEADAYATGVATIGTSDIVVSGYEYRVSLTRPQQFVARMTSSGTVVWKKFYGDGNWGNWLDEDCDVQVDSDDNIYVTLQLGGDNPSWSTTGFTVTKLDSNGNLIWSRCLNGNDSSYLGNSNGNRWSSIHGDQLIVAGYTYETDDDYYNGLWVSLPTDGFTYLGGEGEFVQMGAFRLGQGRIKDGELTTVVGGSFTASEQPQNITAVTDLRGYATRDPQDSFPQHLHKMVDLKHGGLVFGDGTKQSTAGDRIPQIRADDDYYLTAHDSGKHIYFRNNNGTVYIPGWWTDKNLPVGFTFTIVNRTGSDCYVQLEGWPGTIGTILGAGRNISTDIWGIPDSGSGSMVTLIKLEDGHDYNNGAQDGQVWMISGPSDIYNAT